MTYYHNLITQKSWQVLQNFKKEYQFILIGGWAVYLYCQTLKSKDIDLVLAYDQLEKLKQKYPVEKNNRLKKYEVKIEGSRNQKGVIAFAKPYSKNWKLIGSSSESDIVNGYIPGWQIENLKDGTYIIEHNPQKYFAYGSIVSIMILAELIIYLTFDKVVRDSARKSNSQG